MVQDPTARLTAEQVLEHPWVKKYAPTVHLAETLDALKLFNARTKFKAATLVSLEYAHLRPIFFCIDISRRITHAFYIRHALQHHVFVVLFNTRKVMPLLKKS